MALTSVLLEFSEDPLSDASPTWTDVTSDLKTIEWWAGVDREGDEPKPGGATIRVKNTNRRWEPDFETGQFFPNITTGRRFRLTLNDGGGSTQEGVWYVSDIAIDYPAGTGYSEVTMSCSDGCEVLALDALPLMDPPDADSYADAVGFDQPFSYWRLGEPEGTKLLGHLRVITRGKGKKRRKIKRSWKTVETRAAFEAEAGSTGTYRNTPTLGAAGLILGDVDTAVSFRFVDLESADAPVDADNFKAHRLLTVEAWARQEAAVSAPLVAGPITTVGGSPHLFVLEVLSTGAVSFGIQIVGGTASAQSAAGVFTLDAPHHLVGVWNGNAVLCYLDGVLVASNPEPNGVLEALAANPRVYIGREGSTGATATIDEAAIYEKALPAERIAAHYTAGSARGWPQQTAGARIADIATHALWSEANIQTTGRDVMPQFKHGQARLEEIGELAHAEGPRTMFFFNGNGDPVYLGHEWQATSASYNTVQATLGDNGGEVGYEALELVYDNETYNEVTASHESGEAATASDTTAQTERGRRANTEYTDVLLMEHNHVESLANHVLAMYKDPALRPVSVTVNGADSTRLAHILDRDIGHLVRVKKSGETGARIDRVANIIGKRKVLTADKLLTCQWTLSRGFNAGAGLWQAGVVGFSEAGSTTVAA